MSAAPRLAFRPLSIAACITWAAVSYAVWREAGGWAPVRTVPAQHVAAVLLLTFLASTLALSLSTFSKAVGSRGPVLVGALALQVASTFGLLSLGPDSTSPVLLIIVATELVLYSSPVWCWASLLLVNAGFGLVLVTLWHADNPVFVLAIYGGFQAFAVLAAGSMRSAQLAAERLRLTNAELLATRALLAESARDSERLRVSRELHDVVGHKLTALSLNLEVLRRDSTAAARSELGTAFELTQEILSDIRSVVSTLRRHDGIELHDALMRLVALFPRPRVALSMPPDLRVSGAQTAQTVLRCAQEALTNAARHGGATHVDVSLAEDSGDLVLEVEDNGRFAGCPTLGNGLMGLRERTEALRGSLNIDRGSKGGCRIVVRLPKAGAP